MECDEEPFSSMSFPIKHANALVQHAEGDLIRGNRAILIRIIDSEEEEFFLAVTMSGSPPEYRSVIKNLPFKWDDDPGPFGGIIIPEGIQIPQDLFNNTRRFDEISNVDGAISDLANIMAEFRDVKDGYSRIAYECLRKHHDQ